MRVKESRIKEQRGRGVDILERVAGDDLSDKVTLEQSPEWYLEKSFPDGRTTPIKVKRVRCV